MKTVKSIIKQLARPALLALAGVALLASNASAATIEMWVLAKGTTWAILVPGSNTGGKLVYNASYGCYITDRASRGEYMEADFYASTAAERSNPRVTRIWRTSNCEDKTLSTGGCLFTWIGFTVPTAPCADNNYINITTAAGTSSIRIPVGTR